MINAKSRLSGRRFCPFTVLAVLLFAVQQGVADTPQRDLEFASGLVQLGFSDYADKVVKMVLMKNPEMEPSVKIVNAQILIGNRKFDEARAILNSMPAGDPKAQAIELALAGAYYAIGKMAEARAIYDKFFTHYKGRIPTDPDLLRFYRESAYQFGQMLQDAGDYKGAADSFKSILATNPDGQVKRQILADCAKLYLMAAEKAQGAERDQSLDESQKICTDLQWGGMDIWFGQSISTMAHIELLRGNAAGAQKTLEDYMDVLKQVDEYLKESGLPMKESPMAEARYLLGSLYEKNGDNADALKKTDDAVAQYSKALMEYYNVFVKYGESDFGPSAGIKAEAIIAKLKTDYGKEVKVDLGKNKAQAGQQAFKMADNLYRNKSYKEARAEYEKSLAHYPDSPQSFNALVNLAQCYAYDNDVLMAKTAANYLGERYQGNDLAAKGILAVAKIFYEQKNNEIYVYLCDRYIEYFPKHELAGQVLYTLASNFKQNNDENRAAIYFKRLADEYPADRFSIKAMSNLAWTEYANKNYEQAVRGFSAYLQTVQPGHDRAKAQFCLADSYMKLDNYVEALKCFNVLIGWLKPADSLYNTSADAAAKNKDLYEKACFYRGYCCSQVKKPDNLVVPLRKKGLEFFQAFLAEFPNSELAPRAMARMGAIQLELNEFNEAVKTFNNLASKYPNSPEGENALFSLVKSAMEVGKLDVARNAFQDMLSKKSSYKPTNFAGVGQLMLTAGLYPETIQAYAEVLGATEDRALLEPALFGTGKAYYEQQQYDKAISTFEDLMTRYPKSGLFYDAKFVLGSAYRATGNSQKATEALSDVFKYSSDPVLINRANLILGKVQQEQGNTDAAIASFQRVVLLADAKNESLRPIIEECILLSIPLSLESKKYQDVQESCDLYEKLFPNGGKMEYIRNIRREAIRLAALQ